VVLFLCLFAYAWRTARSWPYRWHLRHSLTMADKLLLTLVTVLLHSSAQGVMTSFLQCTDDDGTVVSHFPYPFCFECWIVLPLACWCLKAAGIVITPHICTRFGSSYQQWARVCRSTAGALLASFPRLNFAVPTPILEPLRQWVEEVDRSRLLDMQELTWAFARIDPHAAKYWLPTVGASSSGGSGKRRLSVASMQAKL
jgi:hypothetical protein